MYWPNVCWLYAAKIYMFKHAWIKTAKLHWNTNSLDICAWCKRTETLLLRARRTKQMLKRLC